MDVGVVGVPVIDADPIQLRAEVFFHLPHQLARVCFQVGHIRGVLG